MVVEYVGTEFKGWQRQAGSISVQQVLEDSLCKISKQTTVVVYGAGRTDAGVHATGQVAHFDLDTAMDANKLLCSLNHFLLPHAITVLELTECSPNFDARFDAKMRYYIYRIINRHTRLSLDAGRAWGVRKPLDIKLMEQAASYFLGHHDFSSFRAASCQAASPLRTISDIRLITLVNQEIQLHISARSFLHHMVRNIVGTLVAVGKKQIPPTRIPEIIQAKDRKKAGITAPACGLYFIKVDY